LLIEAFFKNAHQVLMPGGTVRIALCNQQESEFKLHESAEKCLFYCQDAAILRDDSYPGYERRRATGDQGWDCRFGETYIFKRAANNAEMDEGIRSRQLRSRIKRENAWTSYDRNERSKGKIKGTINHTFSTMNRQMCNFFNTPRGCNRGANCTFRHDNVEEFKLITPARANTDVDCIDVTEDVEYFSDPSPLTSEVPSTTFYPPTLTLLTSLFTKS
jgi:hypothetical protein